MDKFQEKRNSEDLSGDQLAKALVDRMNREGIALENMRFRKNDDRERMMTLIRERCDFLLGVSN
jgi:hypothetical protein